MDIWTLFFETFGKGVFYTILFKKFVLKKFCFGMSKCPFLKFCKKQYIYLYPIPITQISSLVIVDNKHSHPIHFLALVVHLPHLKNYKI